MKKKYIFRVLCVLTPILIFLSIAFYKIESIPSTIFLREGQSISNEYLGLFSEESYVSVSNVNQKTTDRNEEINFLGLIAVKSVQIKKVPDIMLYPGGQPLGIKLNTKGVLVVALSDVIKNKEKVNSPAAESGIQIGDSILEVNDKQINTSEQLSEMVTSSGGSEINISLDRKGTKVSMKVHPVLSDNGNSYKIGLWVRDSTAGVGTLTFYDKASNRFGALGHPITDVDTGTILKVSSGQIVESSIISIIKGARGNPGELKGIFVKEDDNLGSVEKNTECGIYGTANTQLVNTDEVKPLRIALRDEIKTGPAKILTTIDGNKPKYYNIEIQKLLQQDSPGPKSMIIKITDEELLSKTGGIVQGMSGSPIIQDNKIVGAVTHVLVNKPDTGYGIYIEWMIKDSNILDN